MVYMVFCGFAFKGSFSTWDRLYISFLWWVRIGLQFGCEIIRGFEVVAVDGFGVDGLPEFPQGYLEMIFNLRFQYNP